MAILITQPALQKVLDGYLAVLRELSASHSFAMQAATMVESFHTAHEADILRLLHERGVVEYTT